MGVDQAAAPGGPAFLRPSAIALVFAGGVLGAGARETLGLVLLPAAGLPVAVLAVNLIGSLLLGWLYEAVDRRALAHSAHGAHERAARLRNIRLFAGAGVLGGFTTYSALAAGSATMLIEGRVLLGAGYAIGTLLLGALAAWGGMLLGGVAGGGVGGVAPNTAGGAAPNTAVGSPGDATGGGAASGGRHADSGGPSGRTVRDEPGEGSHG